MKGESAGGQLLTSQEDGSHNPWLVILAMLPPSRRLPLAVKPLPRMLWLVFPLLHQYLLEYLQILVGLVLLLPKMYTQIPKIGMLLLDDILSAEQTQTDHQ